MLSSALNRKTAKSSFFFHQFSKSSTTKKFQEYQEWGVNLKFYLKGKAAQRLVHSLTFLRTWQSLRNFSRSQFPHPKSGRGKKSQLPSGRAPRELMIVLVNRAFTESNSSLHFQMKSELKEVSLSHQFHWNFAMQLSIFRKFCFGYQGLPGRTWKPLTFGSSCSQLRLHHPLGKVGSSLSKDKLTWKGVRMVRWGTCSSGIQNVHDQHELKSLILSLPPGDTPVGS